MKRLKYSEICHVQNVSSYKLLSHKALYSVRRESQSLLSPETACIATTRTKSFRLLCSATKLSWKSVFLFWFWNKHFPGTKFLYVWNKNQSSMLLVISPLFLTWDALLWSVTVLLGVWVSDGTQKAKASLRADWGLSLGSTVRLQGSLLWQWQKGHMLEDLPESERCGVGFRAQMDTEEGADQPWCWSPSCYLLLRFCRTL